MNPIFLRIFDTGLLNMINHTSSLLYQKIKSLCTMPAAGMDLLFNAARLRQVPKGEMILKEGQVCKTILFVEKGCLRTFVNKDGIEINTDFIFENEFATHLKSLRNSTAADASIQAVEASVVYEFRKDELLGLYKLSPEMESFGRKLLEQLLERQEDHANLFKLYTPAERYQYLVAQQPQLLQRISLSQIASYLGVTRETLSRIRKKR